MHSSFSLYRIYSTAPSFARSEVDHDALLGSIALWGRLEVSVRGGAPCFWGVGFVGGWDLPYIPSLERHAPESPTPYRQTHRKHPWKVVIVHFLFEEAAGKLTFNKTEKSERGMQSQWLLRPRKSHVSSSGQSDLSSCQSSLEVNSISFIYLFNHIFAHLFCLSADLFIHSCECWMCFFLDYFVRFVYIHQQQIFPIMDLFHRLRWHESSWL